MPPGVGIDQDTGVISGRPQKEGVYRDLRFVARDPEGLRTGVFDNLRIVASDEAGLTALSDRFAIIVR